MKPSRKSLIARDRICVIAPIPTNTRIFDRIRTASKELTKAPRGLTLNQVLVDWRAAMQSTCSIPACNGIVRGRGYCSKHYTRLRKYGDPMFVQKVRRMGSCSIPGCNRTHYGLSFCRLHWERNHVNGDPLSVRSMRGATVAERLAHYSQPVGDCIEFTGYRDTDGYGHMSVDKNDVQAHRVSYTINVGPIPDGLIVRHKCDNPPCVDPSHLELGTHGDNAQDRMRRTYTSACNPSAKLTDAEVSEIRAGLGRGETSRSLAEKFGVGGSSISRIKLGTHWNSGPR